MIRSLGACFALASLTSSGCSASERPEPAAPPATTQTAAAATSSAPLPVSVPATSTTETVGRAQALSAETDPKALALLLLALGAAPADDAELRSTVVDLLARSDAEVRRAALRALADRAVAAKVPDYVARVRATLDRDESMAVREDACRFLARSEDEAAIAILEQAIFNPNLPNSLRLACAEGATRSWVDRPYPRRPSKKGYELSMKILEASIAWEKPSIGCFEILQAVNVTDEDNAARTWAAGASFLDKKRLKAAATQLGLDGKRQGSARRPCVALLRGLGSEAEASQVESSIARHPGPL